MPKTVSRYTARFAPLQYWEDPDATKRGFIPVEFWGEIVWARPIFQLGQFTVPTKEFVEENIDKLAVLVEVIDKPKGKLAWSGFTYWEDHTPENTQTDYPYKKVIYSDEIWEMFSSTVEGEAAFYLKHKEDGTVLEISRGVEEGGDVKGSGTGATAKRLVYHDGELKHEIRLDEENVKIHDGVNNVTYETSENGLTITDGVNNIVLEFSGEGARIIDGTNHTVFESTHIHLGGGANSQPLILGDSLVVMLNTVLAGLASHIHPTAMGPSGPPVNAAVFSAEQGKTQMLKSRISETD